MKAIFHHRYGRADVLEIHEIEKPIPQDDEVLIKVRASSINAAEWYSMVGLPIARLGEGVFKPKNTRLGADYSGIVEAVGKSRTDFKVGDEVFGARTGAYAEYICVKNIIIPKPQNITFEEAASVPTAAITALQGLRDFGKIQSGQKVLINGASGGVGHFAVQIAKAFGADVTAVCSTKNVELVRSFGAMHVIDYTKENFTFKDQKYDLLLDVSGTYSWSEYQRALKPNSRFVMIGAPKSNSPLGPLGQLLKVKIGAWFSGQEAQFFIAKYNQADMNFLKELLERGKIKPFVEKTYPLSQIKEAMEHFGQGHLQGKLVITM